MPNDLPKTRLNDLLDFLKTLKAQWEKCSSEIKSDQSADSLTKDLLATEAHALLSLIGIIQIRIGLRISLPAETKQTVQNADGTVSQKEETVQGEK